LAAIIPVFQVRFAET